MGGREVCTHHVLALPVDEQQMLTRVVELEHVEPPASRLTQRRGGESSSAARSSARRPASVV
jgi:hypothetical protein